jgi:hypothetical protein
MTTETETAPTVQETDPVRLAIEELVARFEGRGTTTESEMRDLVAAAAEALGIPHTF